MSKIILRKFTILVVDGNFNVSLSLSAFRIYEDLSLLLKDYFRGTKVCSNSVINVGTQNNEEWQNIYYKVKLKNKSKFSATPYTSNLRISKGLHNGEGMAFFVVLFMEGLKAKFPPYIIFCSSDCY